MTGTPRSRASWVLLAAGIVALLAMDRVYQGADRRRPTYDDAWYLENSVHLYNQLTQGGWSEFVSGYTSSFGIKPPLISVLPLPLYALWGVSERSALLVNSAFIVVSSFFLFLLARRLFSAEVGLAAVLFYQTMPLSYGLSRFYMTEYGLSALVIASLYCLVASDRLTRTGANLALGIFLGLGLLMKVLFPVFVAGPVLLVLWKRGRESWRPLAAVILPAAAIAGTWYWFHLARALEFGWQSAYGPLGALYGTGGFLGWLTGLINRGLSVYYTAGLLALGVAAAALRGRELGRHDGVRFVLAWLLPPLLACALGSNRLIRFLLPALPAVAMLLAAFICELSRRPTGRVLLAGLIAAGPLWLYLGMSIPRFPGPLLRAGPWILLDRDLGWAHAPDARGQWGQERILTAMERLRYGERGAPWVMLGVDHPHLNGNLITYLNAHTRFPFRFTTLAYPGSTAETAAGRIRSWDPLFLLMGEGFPPHSVNPLSDELRARIERAELPYRLVEKISLESSIAVAIYRRDEIWTRASEQPSHAIRADFPHGVRFLGYDWDPGSGNQRVLSCYWTAAAPLPQDKEYRLQLELRSDHDVLLRRDVRMGGGGPSPAQWRPGEPVVQVVAVSMPAQGIRQPVQLTVAPTSGNDAGGRTLTLQIQE
jgi:hypothetical protein